ncbi:MAG TPA: hypothetical protein VGO59_09635 [Verrucomicrobiae bacterium]
MKRRLKTPHSDQRGQFGISRYEPQKLAGIQQNPHLPSNAFKTSSGNGSLKSSVLGDDPPGSIAEFASSERRKSGPEEFAFARIELTGPQDGD